jgi:hypothetical protein
MFAVIATKRRSIEPSKRWVISPATSLSQPPNRNQTLCITCHCQPDGETLCRTSFPLSLSGSVASACSGVSHGSCLSHTLRCRFAQFGFCAVPGPLATSSPLFRDIYPLSSSFWCRLRLLRFTVGKVGITQYEGTREAPSPTG